MTRRARHEARDRFHERRREIRRRFIEEFKRTLIETLRKKFRNSIRRRIEEFEEWRERLSLLRDIITRRARVVFKVEHHFFFRKKSVVFVYDRILMSLPEDQRNLVIDVLRSISEGKGIDPTILDKYPWLRYFLKIFIAYYSKYPCKHMSYAIKLTPVTIHFFKGLKITYYYLRWAYARDVKADPYIGRSRPVDFYISFFRYKYDEDMLNSLIVSGEGTGDYNDSTVAAYDSMRRAEISIPLRRSVLEPHWVKWYFVKIMGKPEAYTVADHCSAYGIIGRISKKLKLYKYQDRRLMGTRPRHRIKEILYRTGLRI